MRRLRVRKNKNADFVGCTIGGTNFNHGLFYMYIQSRVPKQANLISIRGTIDDQFGEAEFEGEITGQRVKFIKEYSRKALLKTNLGSNFDGVVEYEAKKICGVFVGKYTVEILTRFVGEEKILQENTIGKFIMYSPTEENQPQINEEVLCLATAHKGSCF